MQASPLCGVLVYSPAFAGIHCIYPGWMARPSKPKWRSPSFQLKI